MGRLINYLNEENNILIEDFYEKNINKIGIKR